MRQRAGNKQLTSRSQGEGKDGGPPRIKKGGGLLAKDYDPGNNNAGGWLNKFGAQYKVSDTAPRRDSVLTQDCKALGRGEQGKQKQLGKRGQQRHGKPPAPSDFQKRG